MARNRLRKDLRTASREDRRLEAYRQRLSDRLRAEAGDLNDDSDVYMAARAAAASCSRARRRDAKDALRRGMTFEQIAQKNGQTPDAVQRMISRIRFRLRDCIQKKLT